MTVSYERNAVNGTILLDANGNPIIDGENLPNLTIPGNFTDLTVANTATVGGQTLATQTYVTAAIAAVSGGSTTTSCSVSVVGTYGADPTGVSDSTSAFNSAIAAGGAICVPAGTYLISGTITNGTAGSVKNFSLTGGGPGVTTLTSNSTTAPIISLVNATGYVSISGMTLTRSVTAVSGADNLTTNASGSDGDAESVYLSNIESKNGWNGFKLGPATFSTAYLCYAHDNARSGFRLDNGTGSVSQALQWNLISCLAEFNGTFGNSPVGSGFEVTSSGTAGSVTLDTWLYCSTFANMGNGASFTWNGSSNINDIILQSCFFGSDGASEVYASTGGFSNSMIGCRCELAGGLSGQPVGKGAGHTPPVVGHGVELTSAEKDWQIVGCYITSSSYGGISTAAAGCTLVSGCNIRANGRAAASTYSGILGAAGHGQITVNGCIIGNTSSAPTNSQQYGINVASGSLLTATGNDLTYNPVSLNASATPNLVQAHGNLGYLGKVSGAYSVPNSTLTQTITHGMTNGSTGSLTPIAITGTLDGGSAGTTFVIGTISSTTFTVTFSASANGQTFFWTAVTGNYL